MSKAVLAGALFGILVMAGWAAAECAPSWACTSWFPRSNGYQQRSCSDGCGNMTIESANRSATETGAGTALPPVAQTWVADAGVTIAPLAENHEFRLTGIEYLKIGEKYVFRFSVTNTGSFSEGGVRLEAFDTIREFDLGKGEIKTVEFASGYNPLGSRAPAIKLGNYYYSTVFDTGITLSMHASEAAYFGEPLALSGYIRYGNGTGIATPLRVYMDGNFMKETHSNVFGYWEAALAPPAPGNHDVRVEALHYLVSNDRSVLVNEPPMPRPSEMGFKLFPRFIEMAAGGDAVVAIDVNAPEQVDLVFSGLPAGWLKTSSVSVKGEKRVYLHLAPPADSGAGTYALNVSLVLFNGTLLNSTATRITIVPQQADMISGVTGMVIANTSSGMAGLLLLASVAAVYVLWRRKRTAARRELERRARELEGVKKKLADESKRNKTIRYPDIY